MLQLEPPDTVLQGILGWTRGSDGASPAPWKEAPEGRRQARARTGLRLVWECIRQGPSEKQNQYNVYIAKHR